LTWKNVIIRLAKIRLGKKSDLSYSVPVTPKKKRGNNASASPNL